MAWLEPELEVGVDDPLLRPLLELDELLEPVELPELEPVLDEPEPDVREPVLVDPEPVLVDPEPVLPVLVLVPELPEVVELELVDEALLVAPGRTRAIAPAATTLAIPTVTVVLLIRPLPRWRAATARATVSRFELFMT